MPNTSIKHWQDPLNLILGIWMIVSPWALRYQTDMTLNAVMSNAATSNAVILGILIAAAALVALFRVMAWEEWVNVVLGIWLVVSPFILGFNGLMNALWNQVVVGVVVGILAIWSAVAAPETVNTATSK